MFLKVQGGLKVKIEIKRFSEIHSAEYVYDTNSSGINCEWVEVSSSFDVNWDQLVYSKK